MKLIYDPYYFKDFLSKANGNTEDLDFCVSMERIEEVKEFSRRRLPSVSFERFDWSGDAFVRLGNISILEENLHKLEGTKLYPDMKKRENLEYWWRFIPPLYRKFTEFTIEEIYEKPQSEWRSELRDVLLNPVFIKLAKKRPIGYFSHWKGKDYIDALGLSYESAPYSATMIATPLITEPFVEYRCWVYGNEVLNCSQYKDYYYIDEDIPYKQEMENRAKIKMFLQRNLFCKKERDLFPPLFVVDVFLFNSGKIDFVEFNNYESAGRYVYNDIESIVKAIGKEDEKRRFQSLENVISEMKKGIPSKELQKIDKEWSKIEDKSGGSFGTFEEHATTKLIGFDSQPPHA